MERTDTIDRLLKDALSAHARLRKALPGDRTDAARFEALCTQIEQQAYTVLCTGADATQALECLPHTPASPGFLVPGKAADIVGLQPYEAQQIGSWLAHDCVAVQLRFPFEQGDTCEIRAVRPPVPPAALWQATGGARGSKAVLQRFRAQVAQAADGRPGVAINPSGISNSVLTETLREYAACVPGRAPVPAQVAYRDGSAGPAFPLRGTALSAAPVRSGRQLSFALLSIRHTDMDVEVDGAWLRNTVVSRVRPAGDTDRLVYELSLQQLQALTQEGPLTLLMFQTGLETAVVGFYRAVLTVLQDPAYRPGALVVIPHYYRSADGAPHFSEGTPWRT
ncbi:hypothetical protein [Streptomyces sp. NPDC057094]|uniref:hypothetical protein n=1 Tax=Streptomyces sp. NPDC057094 TaxID=3346018 RepID=UPI003631EF01